jgi:hypothetical protein
MQLITQLRARDPAASFQAIATRIGVSKAAVVLWFNGKYPAKGTAIEAKIVAQYDTVDCPYLQQTISLICCGEFNRKDIPTSSPSALSHWRACKTCPYSAAHWHPTKGHP